MPLPHLFKKRSRKTLSRSSTIPIEPLPSPPGEGGLSSSPSSRSSPSPSVVQHSYTTNGSPAQNNSVSPTLYSPSGSSNGEDRSISDAIVGAFDGIKKQQPRPKTKAVKSLEKLEDDATALEGQKSLLTTLADPIKAGLDVSGATQVIQSAVHGFADGLPVFMKALDEVGKIHPFIEVAVLAFKAVYTLEMKRRSNDEKVIALFVEMKDMLAVLLQLKGVKDEAVVGPDGVTIEARMQGLVKQTADDIKKCGNTCDTYSKMTLVAKVLKGPIWEGTFAGLVQQFSKRRTEFEFAMSIHIARKVDDLQDKMDGLAQTVERKTDMILQFLSNYVPQEQKELCSQIDRKGGREAVVKSDEALQELLASQSKPQASRVNTPVAARTRNGLDELKGELQDPNVSIEKNFHAFDRKFEMQQRQIVEEVDKIVHRESDRVILSVTSGPHDRVIDVDLHTIWKDMGWRGSVKARHFVMALRDYYHERAEEKRRKESHFEIAHTPDPDGWTTEWITVKRLQSIVEALDDDSSGYVTVSEANYFTTSRPADWSLQHWVAYWAIGWQITATIYKDKIHEVLGKMFAIRPHIHESNLIMVDCYLSAMWSDIVYLTTSLQPYSAPQQLQGRFQSYIDAEEQRIRKNLETVKYHVDDAATLALVTGPGRIEKYLLPLIFLFLEHDFKIMKICRKHIVSGRNLVESMDSFLTVLTAVQYRISDLKEIFKHQNLDPSQQFKSTSCGLFKYSYEFEDNPSPIRKAVQEYAFPEVVYDDTAEAQNDDSENDVLNYPTVEDHFDSAKYETREESETEQDLRASGPLKAVLRRWTGFMYTEQKYPYGPMFSFAVHAASSDDQKYEANVQMADGEIDFTLIGGFTTTSENQVCYNFDMKIPLHGLSIPFSGQLNEDQDKMSGSFGGEGFGGHFFFFSGISPEILACRPSAEEFKKQRIRSLWRFALSVAEDQVLRRRFTWKYIARRRDIRKRYLELSLRTDYGRPLNEAERKERLGYLRALTPFDVGLYRYMTELHKRTICIHQGRCCDNCGDSNSEITGARIVCLDCDKDGAECIDLCEEPECVAAVVGLDKRPDLSAPHLPTHNMYKLRRLIHENEVHQVGSQARDALQRARAAFDDVAEVAAEQGDVTANEEDRTTKMVQDKLTCIRCKTRVTQPCWYCIVCDDSVFICLECDATGGISQGDHLKTHGLVRCQVQVVPEEPLSLEQKVGAIVNQKFTQVDNQILDVRTELREVHEKLSRMEDLLASIVSTLVPRHVIANQDHVDV